MSLDPGYPSPSVFPQSRGAAPSPSPLGLELEMVSPGPGSWVRGERPSPYLISGLPPLCPIPGPAAFRKHN